MIVAVHIPNVQELANKLTVNPLLFDRWSREVLQFLQGSNIRRIHDNGKNVAGASIGTYSTKPIYVNPKHSPKKFKPQGKRGETVFADGRLHKTRYFEEGYKGFRDYIGRQTESINLQMTGKLKEDFVIESTETNWSLGFMNKRSSKIRQGQEAKHGAIWGITTEDEEIIARITDKYINQALANA